jgi:hypothetical protein
MEGNPVWSNPNYANQLVISLPSLVKLDQQDVTQVLFKIYKIKKFFAGFFVYKSWPARNSTRTQYKTCQKLNLVSATKCLVLPTQLEFCNAISDDFAVKDKFL